MQKAEIKLAGRLRHERGAIGGDKYPHPTSQPASVSYWAALGAWGVLRDTGGRLPSRAQLYSLLQSKHRKARDDDGQVLSRAELPFVALPPRPDDWWGVGPLTFRLMPYEADFLHRQFADLCPRDAPGKKSLFAKLSVLPGFEADACWSPSTLVETLKEKEDRQTITRTHRDNLPVVLEDHASMAGRLDLGKLIEDTRTTASTIPSVLYAVLEKTLAWIADGAKDPMTLRDAYEHAECDRKQHRARLSGVFGASRRMEWDNNLHAEAEPLHYRWRQVSGLLNDLWSAA